MGAANVTMGRSAAGTLNRLTEPEDFWPLLRDNSSHAGTGNAFADICIKRTRNFNASPMLLIQAFSASIVILFVTLIHKPLGQPLVVSQILGGIILGPTVLGRMNFAKGLYPPSSFPMLDVFGVLGVMFYFFLIGVQIDPWVVKTTGKKAYVIGISTALVAYLLPSIAIFFIPGLDDAMLEDQSVLITIGNLAMAGTTFTFPTVARYLYELNILNSRFGRMALSSSIIGGLFNYFYQSSMRLRSLEKKGPELLRIAEDVIFVAIIIYVIQPLVLWALRWRRGEEGVAVLNLGRFYTIFVAVLVTGFVSHAINKDALFGPFILGLTIPPGPPLGSAVVEKLEVITSWIFMPIYFLKFGLGINVISAITNSESLWTWPVISVGSIGKFLGAFISSRFICGIPIRDAIALGLIMNVQGVVELGIYKALKRRGQVLLEPYVVMCSNLLIVTWIVTILLRALYKPSSKWYQVTNRRTILDTKPNTELRILACVHKEDSVPLIIDILEASNHSIHNPIGLYVLHLEELVGRSDPILISHKRGSKKPAFTISNTFTSNDPGLVSERIVNVFQRYEENKKGSISVQSFTAISPYNSMHDDVCMLALEKKTSLIIIPFHKLKSSLEKLNSSSGGTGIRTTNLNVLDQAPCSVAILIEGGLWSSSRLKLASWASCQVLVLFLGGADDREALAYGVRMSGHPNIKLTVVRLVVHSSMDTSFGISKERKKDEYAIMEFKRNMMANKRVRYIEKVVMDGSNTVRVIRPMESDYQLIMVGKRHDEDSPLISGLTDWREYKELGTIGDLLASSELGDASVLVVQNQFIEEEQDSSEDPFNQTLYSRLDGIENIPRQKINTRRG